MKDSQFKLIKNLHEILAEINEEGLNDDEFYNWLNKNYFFKEDLEEIIFKLRIILDNN